MTPQDTIRIGHLGKQLAMDCLREAGYVVQDMRQDGTAASKFIDCTITDPALHRTWSVFVITDSRTGTTANVFVERYIQRQDLVTGAISVETGWLFLCKADILAYLDVDNGTLRLYNWHELKRVAKKADIGVNRGFRDPVDYGATVLAYIVPAKTLENYVLPDDISEPDENGKTSVIKHAPVYIGAYSGLDTTKLKQLSIHTNIPF